MNSPERVNSSLGVEEKPNHISRNVRRKQERLQTELETLHDRLQNMFIDFLMSDDVNDETAFAHIMRYDAKWKTFCTIKGVGGKVPSMFKISLDNIYTAYKEKLKQ